MTQYLLSVVTPAGDGATPPSPDELAAIMARVAAVGARMREAGVAVFSGGLDAPATAVVLRPSGSGVAVVDGPFAEGREYVGGFTVVDVPDREQALRWGREHVEAIGLPIEVRPFAG